MLFGFQIKVEKRDFDYSPYLGPNYDRTQTKYSTILSNHTSAFDPIIFGYLYNARMVSKASLRSVPLIGRDAALAETIFVDWGSDHATKEKIIQQIKDA